jgi:hypothetical protein
LSTIAALIVTLPLCAAPLEAANRCAPSASSGGGCTTSHASMQAAIDAAVAGDTVYGHAGTVYTEEIVRALRREWISGSGTAFLDTCCEIRPHQWQEDSEIPLAGDTSDSGFVIRHGARSGSRRSCW